jgi:hypothetical protein
LDLEFFLHLLCVCITHPHSWTSIFILYTS